MVGAIWTLFVLSLLEITFSFDNAIVNSRVLRTMSRFWQTIFLSVGIIIAVFIVRFILPIVIVMITANLPAGEVLSLATTDSETYSNHLEQALPLINGFGGMFLLLVALNFFISSEKRIHWLKAAEAWLVKLSKVRLSQYILAIIVIVVTLLIAGFQINLLAALLLGFSIYAIIHLLDWLVNRSLKDAVKAGGAGFVAFLYLEILDASFSLDSVIGAFAVTKDILIIVIGLGVGAIFVRSITVHLLKKDTLVKYRYLEHGAHWAIMFLSVAMLLEVVGVSIPGDAVGVIGVLIIISSFISSKLANKKLLNGKPASKSVPS